MTVSVQITPQLVGGLIIGLVALSLFLRAGYCLCRGTVWDAPLNGMCVCIAVPLFALFVIAELFALCNGHWFFWSYEEFWTRSGR